MKTINTCQNCGKVTDKEKAFCLHCGTSTSSTRPKDISFKRGHNFIIAGLLAMIIGIITLYFVTLGWGLIDEKESPQDETIADIAPAAVEETTDLPTTANENSDVAVVSPTMEHQSTTVVEATPTELASTEIKPIWGVALSDSATPEPLPLSNLHGLGYIAYVHYPGGGTTEIHRINADGSGRGFVAMGQSPSISNDGGWIAYEDLQEAPDIFISSNRGDIVRQITTDPAADFNPIWSPDGLEIFFQSERGNEFNYVVSVETREVRNEYRSDWASLTATTGPYQGWAAGTCRIDQADGSSKLSVCLSKGNEEIDIIGNLIPYETMVSTDPWSPDGQFLVLDNNFRLFVFEIATGRYVELPTEGRARDAHWAPYLEDIP